MITSTYTKTYEILPTWASTVPVERDAPATYKGAREGDPCCVSDCSAHLVADEACYSPTRSTGVVPNPDRGEPWVCWRHVRPDDGPITI